MFKKISAFLLAAAMVGGLASCYMPDSIFPEDLFEGEEDVVTGDELSIYGFTFKLSDVEYELPMRYSVLSSRGWKLGGEADETAEDTGASDLTAPAAPAANTEDEGKVYDLGTVMEPGEYSDYVPIDRESEYIALKFYNDGTASRKLEECLVVGVMAEVGSDDLPDLTLDDEITLGDTYEKVVTTYGKPSYVKDLVESTGELAAINDIAFIDDYDEESDDLTRTLYYSVSEHSTVSFELGEYDKEDDAVVRMTIENQDKVEDYYDYSKDVKTRPSIVRLYKGPSLLGKSFSDFAFKYENNLYTLPMPVKVLVDDGWSFVRGAAQRIPVGTTVDGIVMRKGNLAMTILVHNYDMKRAQPPVNCFAVSLSASVVGPNVKILMPKGVTLGSEYSQLVTAFGSEYKQLSGYVEEDEQASDTAADDTSKTAAPDVAVGTKETYELTEEEGCSIVKTVDEEYTVYSYIMPDDVPSITLPVSITDIKDPNADLLGKNRKHIDVYLSNLNGKILKIELQNCPEYVVNENEIIEQQIEAAEKAAKEAKEAEEAAKKAEQEGKSGGTEKTDAAADAASGSNAAPQSVTVSVGTVGTLMLRPY